ncbi:hypothetical protein LFL96_33235 [Paraburkholderia sp. D15]|uniref:hypothetical protein n=1 Tax=Paraburkholderia sp. D15 TaxID=2880218 RepID=UPI0024786665|nr:hypothetical protein [Paraburkholderia sp. D15]WGS53037.1 hypothetical protein LFL96_33235 [Paraburkholderia sp. D15]
MTTQFNRLLEKIASLQRQLNDKHFLELRLYRRDAAIYQLSSAVNHTIACWFSENYRPISFLIDRGRDFMRETPAGKPETAQYYGLAEEFFAVVLSALEIIPDAEARDD